MDDAGDTAIKLAAGLHTDAEHVVPQNGCRGSLDRHERLSSERHERLVSHRQRYSSGHVGDAEVNSERSKRLAVSYQRDLDDVVPHLIRLGDNVRTIRYVHAAGTITSAINNDS
jgi:hypothetical protein